MNGAFAIDTPAASEHSEERVGKAIPRDTTKRAGAYFACCSTTSEEFEFPSCLLLSPIVTNADARYDSTGLVSIEYHCDMPDDPTVVSDQVTAVTRKRVMRLR